AAALAAGEVPSPAMVAAAGGSDAWPLPRALACIGLLVVGLALCLLLYRRGMVMGRTGFPIATDVLTAKAREILGELGLAQAQDSAVGYDHDDAYLRWIQEADSRPERWDELEKPRPAALYFWYRQSPQYLVPTLFYPYQGTLE